MLRHDGEAIAVSLVLLVGRVVKPETGIGELRYLPSLNEVVVFGGRGNHPLTVDMEARGQSYRGIYIVGIAPVTNRSGGTLASQIIVEITVTDPRKRRKRNPAARQIILAEDQTRFENGIRNRIRCTGAFVLERAVRISPVNLDKPALDAGRGVGAGHTRSASPDLYIYARLLIGIVRQLRPDFPTGPGSQAIGRRNCLCLRDRGNANENCCRHECFVHVAPSL